MITREQIADLHPGDVVEITDHLLCTTRGPLRDLGNGSALLLGAFCVVRYSDGEPARPEWSRTVISRAPRPLYVNHDRTEPVEGDVFQSEYSQWPLWIAGRERIAEHKAAESCRWIGRDDLPDRLRLLVDGETGRCVP